MKLLEYVGMPALLSLALLCDQSIAQIACSSSGTVLHLWALGLVQKHYLHAVLSLESSFKTSLDHASRTQGAFGKSRKRSSKPRVMSRCEGQMSLACSTLQYRFTHDTC